MAAGDVAVAAAQHVVQAVVIRAFVRRPLAVLLRGMWYWAVVGARQVSGAYPACRWQVAPLLRCCMNSGLDLDALGGLLFWL